MDEMDRYVTQYASTFRYYIDEGNDGYLVRQYKKLINTNEINGVQFIELRK